MYKKERKNLVRKREDYNYDKNGHGNFWQTLLYKQGRHN